MGSTNHYKFAADVIVVFHVVWTVILFGGAFFVFYAPWYATFQIITISFTLLISLPFGSVCPLTLLEERLRKKIDPAYTNNGSYLLTYINKVFDASFKKKSIVIAVAIFYTISIGISVLVLVRGA